LWDAETGQQIYKLKMGGMSVWSGDWSPDMVYLTSGNGRYEVKTSDSTVSVLLTPE